MKFGKTINILIFLLITSIIYADNNLLLYSYQDDELIYEDDIIIIEDNQQILIGKPPLNPYRIIGESCTGLIVGGLFLSSQKDNIDQIGLAAPLLIIHCYITSVLVSGSTSLIGKIGDETGSFKWPFYSSFGGGLTAMVLNTFINEEFLTSDSFMKLYLPGSVLGALVGFNITREYDENYYSILNFNSEKIHVGLPKISYNHFEKEYKINLFEWNF